MATDHTVVKTRGPHDGRFTFTSHDAGDHSICLSTNFTAGWFTSRHIKLYIDIVVGASKPDVEHDRSHIGEVASKIRELNDRLRDIRREQQYQREREAAYRDLSEATNSRAVWYCVGQIIVLVATCTWQLRHLRVRLRSIFIFSGASPLTSIIFSVSLKIGKCDEVQDVLICTLVSPRCYPIFGLNSISMSHHFSACMRVLRYDVNLASRHSTRMRVMCALLFLFSAPMKVQANAVNAVCI